jgi:hypothetical protein
MSQRIMRSLLATTLLIGTAACSSSLDGKYEDRNGVMGIEFKSGTAYVSTPAGTVATKYQVDGDRIILSNEGGNLVLTRASDGALDGPTGKMVKAK